MTPGVGPFFTPGHEWLNLCSALHNNAEYKTYKIWFLVVSVVSEKMISSGIACNQFAFLIHHDVYHDLSVCS